MTNTLDRAKRGEGKAKRFAMNLTTTASMKRKLMEAADRSGRSQTQEVEYRLERSFMLDEVAGDHATAMLCQFVQMLAHNIKAEGGFNWRDEPVSWNVLSMGLARFLEANRPDDEGVDEEREMWKGLETKLAEAEDAYQQTFAAAAKRAKTLGDLMKIGQPDPEAERKSDEAHDAAKLAYERVKELRAKMDEHLRQQFAVAADLADRLIPVFRVPLGAAGK